MGRGPFINPAMAILDPIIATLARREQQQAEAANLAAQEQKDLAKTQEEQRRWEALFQLQRDQFAAQEADRAVSRERQAQLDTERQADRQVSRLAPGVISPGVVDMDMQRQAGNAAMFSEQAPMMLGGLPVPGVMSFSGDPQQLAAAAAARAAEEARQRDDARADAQLQESIRHNKASEARMAQSAAGPAQQDWVIRDGKVTPITRGTARPGDMPYDEKKTSQIDDPEDAKQVTQTALDIAKRLKTHGGLGAATGANDIRKYGIPFIPGNQSRADFNGLRNQLVAALTLPNLGALKGPMSDKDVAFVKSISTRLGDENLSEAETVKALDEAITFLEGKMGGAGKQSAPKKVGRFEIIEEP